MITRMFNYMPDPDFKFETDINRKGAKITFIVETKVDILDPDVAKEIQAAFAAGNHTLGYGLIYGYAQDEFDMAGQGHALVQAAVGILQKNQAAADALRCLPRGGKKPKDDVPQRDTPRMPDLASDR